MKQSREDRKRDKFGWWWYAQVFGSRRETGWWMKADTSSGGGGGESFCFGIFGDFLVPFCPLGARGEGKREGRVVWVSVLEDVELG
jgi:hypothetical protein